MPDVNNDKYVFYSHLLKLSEQFFTAAFLISIIISLHDLISAWIKAGVTLILVLGTAQPISDYTSLCVSYLLSPCNKTHDKINMDLLTNCSGERLVGDSFLLWLFSKTDWVNHALHLSQFVIGHEHLLSCDILIVVWCSIFLEIKPVVMSIVSTKLKY